MTAEQITEMVRRTRAEQGLPEKITDPVTLDRVAGLLGPLPTEQTPMASAAGEDPVHAA